jgi:hypothetical protein
VLGTIATGIPLSVLVRYVASAGPYSGWQDRLWFIWAAIAVVYVAGAAVVSTRSRRSRQLPGKMQQNRTEAGA